MTRHWAVMNDTGEVIAEGETFTECQRKAFATRRWTDPNTGEFMPAGSTCPYRLQTWEPLTPCPALARSTVFIRGVGELHRVNVEGVVVPDPAQDEPGAPGDMSLTTPTGRKRKPWHPEPWQLP